MDRDDRGRSVGEVASEFEAATAVEAIGEGRYAAHLAEGWDIGGNANGGYLVAVAARAMGDAVGRPPLSVTTHFVAPGPVGPAVIDVEVVRDGRRMAVVRGVLSVADRTIITLLGTFAHPAESTDEDLRLVRSVPPDLPPIEECVRTMPPVESGFGDRTVNMYHPDDAGFRSGEPTGTPLMRSWFQFADGGSVDAYGLLQVADALAPVCFNAPGVGPSWAPTLELTTHVRGTPAPGPLRVRFESRNIGDGYFEEDGEMWDADGRLVAQSRQIALMPRGRLVG